MPTFFCADSNSAQNEQNEDVFVVSSRVQTHTCAHTHRESYIQRNHLYFEDRLQTEKKLDRTLHRSLLVGQPVEEILCIIHGYGSVVGVWVGEEIRLHGLKTSENPCAQCLSFRCSLTGDIPHLIVSNFVRVNRNRLLIPTVDFSSC